MPLLGSNNNLDLTISTTADTRGIKQTQEGIQGLNSTAEEGTGKVGGLNGVFSTFGSTLMAVGEAFVAYQLVNQVEDFFGGIISSAGGLEQTNIAFQAMIGNAQEANSVFGQLVQYANVTPFQAQDIEDAARTLLAFGTGGQQTVDVIKQIGDVAAVGGANIQDLARISGQIFSSGKFDAREFLELIRDGGAGIIKTMAENAGGMANLRAEMEKGKVSSTAFFDALNESVGKGGFAFQGAQREAETFNGRLSTLKDAATMAGLALIGMKLDPQLGLQVQPGGLFDQMKGGISGITDALNGMQPTLEAIMPQFIDNVHRLWDQLAHYLGPVLHDLWDTISTKLAPAMTRFWHEAVEPLLPLFGVELVAALYLLILSLENLFKIISIVLNLMSDLADRVAKTYDIIKQAISEAIKVWHQFTQDVEDTVRVLGDTWHRFTTTLKSDWDAAVKWATDKLDYLRGHFLEVIGYIIGYILTIPLRFIAAFTELDIKLLELVFHTFLKVYDTIHDHLEAAANWVSNINWGAVFQHVVTASGSAQTSVFDNIRATFTSITSWVSNINWVSVFSGIGRAIGGVAVDIWNAIKHVFDSIRGLDWGGIMVGIGKGIANAIIDLINGAIKGAFEGVPVLKDHVPHISHFATGTKNFGGGWAVLGEQGPELAFLPPGSSVATNAQSQSMLRGTTNNRSTQIGTVIINTPQAADRFWQGIDQDTINIGRGLTTSRGMAA